LTTTIHNICDAVPDEEEICEGVKRMRRSKAPGGSGIHVEHLQSWMEGAKPRENHDPIKVDAMKKVVQLVQSAFTEQPLPQSFGVGILVLIPKAYQISIEALLHWKLSTNWGLQSSTST
jgi:hypothetical protein